MNKKLLFGIMSLAALTACTNDDFESQKVAQQEASPIQFEVLNSDALTRASMNGNKVVFSATDGDLFTLYHGGTIAADGAPLTAFQNATYTASAAEGEPATLTTPTMINPGYAIMTWPADTTFRANPAGLSIVIPQNQTEEIQNEIPYVSDVINILAYAAYTETAPATAYNTAGKDRKYSVYMRPMASQLNLKAEYNGTDAQLATLYTGDDPIDEINVTSIELLTTPGGGTTDFTTEIPLKFMTAATYAPAVEALPTAGIAGMWNAADANNAWSHVTCFDVAGATGVDKLTTKYLDGIEGAKFLILPQAAIVGGLADPGVVVNTRYGKVVIADPAGTNVHGTKYSAAEYAAAWYRYLSARKTVADTEENASAAAAETTGPNAGKYKTVAISPAMGMQQTINYMSTYEAKASLPAIQSEPLGVALTRYVDVNLGHLDMSELHIKDDKQLRDAARVWQTMNLDDVTVYLDGNDPTDANGEFEISQTTIQKINEINASIPGGAKSFKVKPCQTPGEVCKTIVITGGGNIKDLTFIKDNAGTQAAVAFKAGENWKWAANNTVKVANTACGISKFINRGTFTSDATATINVKNDLAAPTWVNMPFENAEGATWNVSGATLNVQFNVTNYGTVKIATGAQYRQDGQAGATTFINEATTLPNRITKAAEHIGKVENKGVFATVSAGVINNYGLIEHADPNAKTYITNNQLGGAFGTAFGGANKMGRINLPFSNKEEDNVSISAALAQGFVSVTVNGEVTGALDASVVGAKVNYVIINSGITEIQAVAAQVQYLEINQPGTELAWNVPTTTEYDGLIVLSDVNIKLGTKIVATVTYLGADMYVGGKFNQAALAAEGTDPAYAATNFNGYFGNTTGNVGSKYITY